MNCCNSSAIFYFFGHKWNVMPLLGNFGRRVGKYRFLQSPTIQRRLPSLFICRELFSFCHLLNMLCELSRLFNKKEGVEEQFPEVVRISHHEKLWNHLNKRELRDFRSTNEYKGVLVFLLTQTIEII